MTEQIHQNLTGRGCSVDLWRGLNFDRAMTDPSFGYGFYDDFHDLPTGKYTATQATAGTFAITAGRFGVATADSGSTTGGQGISVQLGGIDWTPNAAGIIVCEGYFTPAANATGPQFLFGIADSDTTLLSSAGAVSSHTNSIGFHSASGNTLKTLTRATTSTTADTTTALVASTPVKLGFRVTGTSKVDFYINGLKISTVKTTIPTANMRLSLVCQTNATTQPTIAVDWWRIGYFGQ